jgi:dihydrofolate reductase
VARLLVRNFSISLDGYAAGPHQDLDNPLGVGGGQLHEWIFVVLTHQPRAPIEMQGGTTFHFVDGGIEEALRAAFEAAGDRDVLVGGGAATIRQYLRASLIDEMHFAIVPVLLGSGERLFDDLGPSAGNYRCVERVCSPAVTHVRIARTGRDVVGGLQR